MRRAPQTLRARLVSAMLPPLFLATAGGSIVGVLQVLGVPIDGSRSAGIGADIRMDEPSSDAPGVGDHVHDLVAAHHCWTGQAPSDLAGRQPGHVVLTTRSGTTYAGQPWAHRALDVVLGRDDPAIVAVHAFCR